MRREAVVVGRVPCNPVPLPSSPPGDAPALIHISLPFSVLRPRDDAGLEISRFSFFFILATTPFYLNIPTLVVPDLQYFSRL